MDENEKPKLRLSTVLTTVTPFSKYLALFLLIVLPFVGLLGKGTIVCSVSMHAWCGGSGDVDIARQGCTESNIDFSNIREEGIRSNYYGCCRGLETNRPYTFACGEVSNLHNNIIEDDGKITGIVLKEAGIDCSTSDCLESIMSDSNLYIKGN